MLKIDFFLYVCKYRKKGKMLYDLIYNDDNEEVKCISYNSNDSDNLELIDRYSYSSNNKENINVDINNEIDNDNKHIKEHVIKNDQKYMEALFEKYIDNLNKKFN